MATHNELGRDVNVLLASLTSLLVLTACNDVIAAAHEADTADGTLQMLVVSGQDQSAPAGTELAEPLVVRVLGGNGKAVRNQIVNFRVTEGDGSVFGGTAMTNGEGIAQERWTLGSAGPQRLEARAVDATTGEKQVFATFNATATTGTAGAVTSVSVSPESATLATDSTRQFTATARDAAGNIVSGAAVSWSTIDPTIASVSGAGMVRGLAPGSTTVRAVVNGVVGTATVNVVSASPVAVASVSVSPSSASLTVGATQQLTATARDANGNILSGRAVTWSTSNSSVATVSTSGLVTAHAAGPASITAAVEGRTGSSAITVTAPTTSASIFSDDFEMSNWSRTAAGWDTDWNINSISIISGHAGRNSRIARFRYSVAKNTDHNVALTLNTRTLPAVDHLFIRGYLYLPDPGNTPQRLMQRKLFYLTSHTAPSYNLVLGVYGDGDHDGRPNWYLPGTINGVPYAGWQSGSVSFDTWMYVELEVRLNTPGQSNGEIRLWVNNAQQPVLHLTGRNIRGNSSHAFTEIMFGQQLQGDANSLTEYRYWDNLAVSTSRIGP